MAWRQFPPPPAALATFGFSWASKALLQALLPGLSNLAQASLAWCRLGLAGRARGSQAQLLRPGWGERQKQIWGGGGTPLAS